MSNRNFLMFSGSFILGSAAGFAIGYFVLRNKYRELADKEIESVRKVYEKHFKHEDHGVAIGDNNLSKKDFDIPEVKAASIGKTASYNKLYTGNGVHEAEIPETIIKSDTPRKTTKAQPYIITPDEFEESEYSAETLYWFSDKVLTDSDYNVIHDVNGLIGPEALNTFGRYLDDTVYVRDDADRIDYEIIWDARKYSTLKSKLGDNTLPDND